MPTQLKVKPKAGALKKAPAAAPKPKKQKPAPAKPEAFGDEDEIKIPELDLGEEDLPVAGAEDGSGEHGGEDAAPAEPEADEIPDPFASDDEEEEAAETVPLMT